MAGISNFVELIDSGNSRVLVDLSSISVISDLGGNRCRIRIASARQDIDLLESYEKMVSLLENHLYNVYRKKD